MLREDVTIINGKPITYQVCVAIDIIAEDDYRMGRLFANLIDADVTVDELLTKVIKFDSDKNNINNLMKEKHEISLRSSDLIRKCISEYMVRNELGELIDEDEYCKRFWND